jgi:hypothetical protein
MNPQNDVIRASSLALKVAGVKGVSLTETKFGAPAMGMLCSVVAQAAKPFVWAPGVAALQAPDWTVDSTLITIDVGTAGVRVLLIKSLCAERETSAFAVTVQEQHEISCSSGENV